MRSVYEDGGVRAPGVDLPEPAEFEVREASLDPRNPHTTYHKVWGIRVGNVGLHIEFGELHVSYLGDGDHRGKRLGRPFHALAPAYHFLLAAARHLNEFGHSPAQKMDELRAARSVVEEKYYA